MRTRKTSRRPRHPSLRFPHRIGVTLLAWLFLALAADLASPAAIQAAQAPTSSSQQKKPPADDCLLFGTVFDEQGFAMQGAKIEVHRAGEKKVRGRAISDRRGEFGIRVPRGAEYEVRIEARGYEKAGRKIDAKTETRVDFVERLKPLPDAGKKKPAGGKKP